MTMQRFHVDTRFVKDLPDKDFPFTFQVIDADTGEEIYTVVVESRRASFLMPIYKGTVKRVTIRVIWPGGEVTEMTRPYAEDTELDAPAAEDTEPAAEEE